MGSAKERIRSEFDEPFYLSQFTPDDEAPIDPIAHYLETGWRLGLDPTPVFSTEYYLEANPDIREAGVNPFLHYIERGRREGRPSLEVHRRLIAFEFDVAYYLEEAACEDATKDPVAHYLVRGWRQGLDPTPAFSTAFYLERHGDVRQGGQNPFVHYLSRGRGERRETRGSTRVAGFNAEDGRIDGQNLEDPDGASRAKFLADRSRVAPEFDAAFYVSQSPILSDPELDPVLHYLTQGWREGRDPSPDFSTGYYLACNPDVKEARENPFVHFVTAGRQEGRLPQPPEMEVRRDRALIKHAFDVGFYLEQSADLNGAAIDPVTHYLQHGWRERRNPSPEFDTDYYLRSNPDIATANINPFVHYMIAGKREGRHALPYTRRIALSSQRPLVSVIIPNYNHARFLPERIESILNQSYNNTEIIILDDCSSDNSREIIQRYLRNNPGLITALFNKENSGNVFRQWQAGISAAKGPLIWICESDDFCDRDFLTHLVPAFADSSVMLAFGRIQFAEANGEPKPGLDDYRENAEPGIWSQTMIRSAYQWFSNGFGKANIIPNVGGCVFRKQDLPEAVWETAKTYEVCGDWYLYMHLAAGGRIAYVPDAVSYFRQHSRNTSVRAFLSPRFYVEHEDILTALRAQWGVSDRVAAGFYGNLARHYEALHVEEHLGALRNRFRIERALDQGKEVQHILMCILGFHLGGGEIFPIHLANALVERGYRVSMLCVDTAHEEPGVRAMLSSRVAVYDAQLFEETGAVDALINDLGIDIVHSHSLAVERFFFSRKNMQFDIPYIVTLHGSYECDHVPDDLLLRIVKRVDHWVYLDKKNLKHLEGIPLSSGVFTRMPNGMPAEAGSFAKSRQDLGIGCNDIVFVLATRAIKEKGWRTATEAVLMAQQRSERRMVLLLCGSGPEADTLSQEHRGNPNILFLGFQPNITAIYGLADCALLPTRFAGESFPLTIIQAFQASTPVIATDLGGIRGMVYDEGVEAGLVIEPERDDNVFVQLVAAAMLGFTDDKYREEKSRAAKALSTRYDIKHVAERYRELYRKLLHPIRDEVRATEQIGQDRAAADVIQLKPRMSRVRRAPQRSRRGVFGYD